MPSGWPARLVALILAFAPMGVAYWFLNVRQARWWVQAPIVFVCFFLALGLAEHILRWISRKG